MSHVVTAEMLVINLALMCVILIKKTLEKPKFLAFVKAVILCVGMSAWFIVPFMDYIISQKTMVQEGDLRILENNTQDFIYMFQMFSPGNEGKHYLTIGLSMILAIIIVLYCLVKYCKNGQENSKTLRLFAGFGLMNLAFVSSYFPWGRIQKYLHLEGLGYQIGTIQFSWRFYCVVSVVLTFAVVIALEKMQIENKKLYEYFFVAMLLSIVIAVGFYYYEYPDEVGSRGRNTYPSYSNSDALYLLEGASKDVRNSAKVQVLEGEVQICGYEKEKGIAYIEVDNTGNQEALIRAPIYAYKYYKVYEKDKEVAYTNTKQQCIAIEVPANFKGEYKICFEPPMSWRISELISLFFVIGTVGWLVYRYDKNKLTIARKSKFVKK